MKVTFNSLKSVKKMAVCGLLGIVTFAQISIVNAESVIYVTSNTKLNGDHNGCIVFKKANVYLDLNGYKVYTNGAYGVGIQNTNYGGNKIYGNKSNPLRPGTLKGYNTGIYVTGICSALLIENLTIEECNFGINFTNGCQHASISNVTAKKCGYDGFVLIGENYSSDFYNCTADSNSRHGFLIQDTKYVGLNGCKATNNTKGYGFVLIGSKVGINYNTTLTNCIGTNNLFGLYLGGYSDSYCYSSTFNNNLQFGIQLTANSWAHTYDHVTSTGNLGVLDSYGENGNKPAQSVSCNYGRNNF